MASTVRQNLQFLATDEQARTDEDQEYLAPDKQKRDSAHYLCDMILQLREIAKAAKLAQVCVPLEYAYYEAFSVANKTNPMPGEAEWIRKLETAVDDPNLKFEIPGTFKESDETE